MIRGIWGKKIGMTQVFSDDQKVVPVTAIDVSNWFITQVKTKERDGYDAVQLGCSKKQYHGQDFSSEWLHAPKKHFAALREIRLANSSHAFTVGQAADLNMALHIGDAVDVVGITIGKGFQGAVKRHGFTGGRGSHGDKLGRGPGALSCQRASGRVSKGKKMPGHMGVTRRVIKNLKVVKIEPQAQMFFVKGSIPGKTGSLVFVRKCGVDNGTE